MSMIFKYNAYLLYRHSLYLPLAGIRNLLHSISFLQFPNFLKVLSGSVVLKNEVGERLHIEVSKKCNLARILHSVRKKVGERRSPTFPPPLHPWFATKS